MENTFQSVVEAFASTQFNEEHCTGVLCEKQIEKAAIEQAATDTFGNCSVHIVRDLFSNFDFVKWDTTDLIVGEYYYGDGGQLPFRYDFFFRRVSSAPVKCLEFLWDLTIATNMPLIIENVFYPTPVSGLIFSADKVQEVFLEEPESPVIDMCSLGEIYWPKQPFV